MKKWFVRISLILLLSYVIVAVFLTYKKNKQQSLVGELEHSYNTVYEAPESINFQAFKGNKYALVRLIGASTTKNGEMSFDIEVGHKYFFVREERERFPSLDFSDNYPFEFNRVLIYDMLSGKKEKTLDLFKILHTQANVDRNRYKIYSWYAGYQTGKEYFLVTVSDRRDESKEQNFLLDVQDESLKPISKEEEKNISQTMTFSKMLETEQKNINLSSQLNLSFYTLGQGLVSGTDFTVSDLSKLNFSKEYPEIIQEMSKGPFIIYARPGKVSEEEFFNDMNHWFAPQGQEYRDLPVVGKDGKQTIIHTYKDFVEWEKSQKGG